MLGHGVFDSELEAAKKGLITFDESGDRKLVLSR
jgi:hypothetical protein